MVQFSASVPRSFLVLSLVLTCVFLVACTGGRVTSAVAPPIALPSPAATAASARTVASVPTVIPPPTPRDLVAQLPGQSKSTGVWTPDKIDLSARGSVKDGMTLSLEVEVASVGKPFLGTPTARGASAMARNGQIEGSVSLAGLKPDRYVWQARFVDANGVPGAWQTAPVGQEFAVVGAAPRVVDLTLEGTHETESHIPLIGANDHPTLRWHVQADLPESIDAAYVSFDQKESSPSHPPVDAKKLDPTQTAWPLPDLKDGTWYAHLWASDRAGQTGSGATLRFETRRTPPVIANVVYRSFVTNPQYQALPIRFTVGESSQVDVLILPKTATSPLRTFHVGATAPDKTIAVSWDGKDDKGHIVPAGSYRFEIRATDSAGNTAQMLQSGLTITNKVIVVSLANESLRALDGNQLFLSTLVTSGGQELPTRRGQFDVVYKSAPFIFHSPFPKGTRFWYPDTPSNYAMLFDPEQGNFIHDAPWRTVFGPGTDGPGTPGYSIYAGSHGCVELPTSTMARLYAWTPAGTPVVVQ